MNIAISIVFCALICASAGEFTGQWVLSATATTEDTAHRASNIPGTPDNVYWTAAVTNTPTDSIEIVYQNSICISGITIYEYYNIGLTVGIYAYSPSGTWDLLWSGASSYATFAGALGFSPNLIPVTYTTNKFKVVFDTHQTGQYPQINGVRVFGTSTSEVVTMTSQWAKTATATSEQSTHMASNIPAPPSNLYWSPVVTSQTSDSVEIFVQNSICVAGIVVYEYQVTGMTIGIYAYSPSGTWDQLWTGPASYASYDGALGFSANVNLVAYTTNRFKIVVDSSQSAHVPQVAAIRVFGRSVCPVVNMVNQWAQSATASSEQSTHTATNIPNTPGNVYWSPLVTTQKSDSIEITIQSSICVVGITVYEYQVTGLTTGIYAFSPSGIWEQLWSGASSYVSFTGALGFTASLVPVTYTTNKFKFTFDSSQAGHAPQVNGVRIFGTNVCAVVTLTSQWAKTASATTEQSNHLASNIPSPPSNTYWSPVISSQRSDSVEILVQNNVCVYGVAVYEFQVTGLTIGIYAFSPYGTWDPLWTGSSNYVNYDGVLGFLPTVTSVTYITNKFKLVFDSSQPGHAPQVNGIRVFGRSVCPSPPPPPASMPVVPIVAGSVGGLIFIIALLVFFFFFRRG